MLFKLGMTSHLVSTWTKETFWRLAITILPLFIFFLCYGTPQSILNNKRSMNGTNKTTNLHLLLEMVLFDIDDKAIRQAEHHPLPEEDHWKAFRVTSESHFGQNAKEVTKMLKPNILSLDKCFCYIFMLSQGRLTQQSISCQSHHHVPRQKHINI